MTSYDSFCCFRSSSNGRARVLWELNTACNLACSFCHAIPNVEPGIEHADIIAGLRILRRWGIDEVIFSGGEPMLRHDIFTIMEEARSLGFAVDLCTNGTLIDKDVARRLSDLLSEVSVSLDAADAANHDALRRQLGSWSKAVGGIKNLVTAGLEVHVISIVTDRTASSIEETTRFVRGLGAESVTLLGLMPYPERNGSLQAGKHLRVVQPHEGTPDRLSLHTRLTLEAHLPEIRHRLHGFRINSKCVVPSQRMGFCGAGSNVLGVDARGNLLPCILLKGMREARRLLDYEEYDPRLALQTFEWSGRLINMREHKGGCIAVESECWRELRA